MHRNFMTLKRCNHIYYSMIENQKILLLNSDYRPLNFVTWNRALKLLLKEKVDVVSEWEGKAIRSVSGAIQLPATLRLRSQVRFFRKKIIFSKAMVKKRDNYTCQYCGVRPSRTHTTIDHVIPVSKGGQSSYENCVTACYKCNNKKNDRLLSQIGMRLKTRPTKPCYDIYYGLTPSSERHPDWHMFLK